jgi:hypothetical protein
MNFPRFDFSRFRLGLIFWLLAPAALLRRLRRRRSGWVSAEPHNLGREP